MVNFGKKSIGVVSRDLPTQWKQIRRSMSPFLVNNNLRLVPYCFPLLKHGFDPEKLSYDGKLSMFGLQIGYLDILGGI